MNALNPSFAAGASQMASKIFGLSKYPAAVKIPVGEVLINQSATGQAFKSY